MTNSLQTEQPAFDHLLHWVPDVDAAVAAYTAAGMPAHANPPDTGFQHGGWRMDERYVEILTVTDEERFRAHMFAQAWTALEPAAAVASRAGGGAMTFAVNVTDVGETAARLLRAGHKILDTVIPRESTGGSIGFREVFLLDAPSWAPFFITYDPPREVFLAQIPAGAFPSGDFTMTEIVIETPDPARSAAWLAAVIGLPVHDAVLDLPGGAVRFVPGPADRIIEAVLSGPRPLDVTPAGLRWHTQ
ncbi:VOC family protein [Nocardia sp. 2]|uniref:VOC family protein n=1 Tax=Nocardia acididurans TaxID=2802282 RepID=A0ABS1MEJ4_9NOCA|nr:VOC family protein [Nocardia acididurans]MBL1078711.1 VOC family protein [Nocardia acididurans]